jgi:hypothetical protein
LVIFVLFASAGFLFSAIGYLFLLWGILGYLTYLSLVFISFWKVSLNNKNYIGLQSTCHCFGYPMKKPKISSNISLSSLRSSISLAVAVKFSAIAIAVIVFYLQDLGFIFNNALSDESSTHLLIIPFMFLYILYRKRKVLLSSVNPTTREFLGNTFDTAIGALLSATSILITGMAHTRSHPSSITCSRYQSSPQA